MTREDIIDWLECLAPTVVQRRTIVYDLLYNKGRDHMSAEDEQVCRRAITMLNTNSGGRTFTIRRAPPIPFISGDVELGTAVEESL